VRFGNLPATLIAGDGMAFLIVGAMAQSKSLHHLAAGKAGFYRVATSLTLRRFSVNSRNIGAPLINPLAFPQSFMPFAWRYWQGVPWLV
jgi:hypothetical protein